MVVRTFIELLSTKNGINAVRGEFTLDTGWIEVVETTTRQDPRVWGYEMENKVEDLVIKNEDIELMKQSGRGDINPVTATPVHPQNQTGTQRRKRLHGKLVREVMKRDNIRVVDYGFYPVWKEIRITQAQDVAFMANYLGLDLADGNKVETRFVRYDSARALLDNDAIDPVG